MTRPLHQDPEALDAYRRGDRELLSALYRAHLPAVERLLMHGFSFQSQGKTMRFAGFRRPWRIHETLQEVFLKAFGPSARRAYDGRSPFAPYLLRIARNQVLDQLRRDQLERTYLRPMIPDDEGKDPLEQLEDPAAKVPETATLEGQVQQVLVGFLASLEAQDRWLVEHHLVGGMGQREASEALGISRNDLRRQVKSLRQRLLRQLKASGLIDALEPGQALAILALWGLV